MLHVPGIRLVHVHLALCCQEMKGGQLLIIHRMKRPAVTTIGIDVGGCHSLPFACPDEEFLNIQPALPGLLQRHRPKKPI